MPSAPYHHGLDMFQKGHVRPMLNTKIGSGATSEESEMDDTDFEEDLSDGEAYSGRRSEESVSLNQLRIKKRQH